MNYKEINDIKELTKRILTKQFEAFMLEKDKQISELNESNLNLKKSFSRFETYTFLENENTRIAFANKVLDKYRNKIKELQAENEKLKKELKYKTEKLENIYNE